MTALLLRLFVKRHNDTESAAVRSAVGRLAGIVGVFCNMLLFLIKLLLGIFSGALSVTADALNNLSDAASSVVTLFGFRLAQRPADQDHPYGHARYEYLSGLCVAVLILFIGFELVKSAISRIFNPVAVDLTYITFAILLCSVGIKLWMSAFFASLGKRIGSAALKATFVDCRNDAITSTAVLLGCIVERSFGLKIDGYIGLAVAVFVLYSGVAMARETISPLLGQQADKKLLDDITSLVCVHEKVRGVHDLLVHDYGPGRCYASAHVELSAEEDTIACHDIIDAIENDALEKLNVDLVIHCDPVLENDAEWTQMRQLTEDIVKEIDQSYSIHDFRLVRGGELTKLVFDLAVPYCAKVDAKSVRGHMDAVLSAQNYHYNIVVCIDNKA